MTKVEGRWDPKFEEVRTLFGQFLESGDEVGAAITVNVDGQDVVDIWGGYADPEKSRPWNEDTIVCVYSTSKAITALAIYILVERGLLDINEKVAKYWPEFAQNGKEGIEVRHLLSHTSGISGWDDRMTAEDLCKFEEAVAKLEKQAPYWTPGTASGYHVWTYGMLLGELVRRTTGKTLKQFVAEEMAAPLSADFQLGALEKDWSRVATLIPPPPTVWESMPEIDPTSSLAKSVLNPPPDADFANTPTWRRAELGAANGHANAKGVVRLLSAITLGGEVGGKRLLSPDLINRIFEEQAYGLDLNLGVKVRLGIGFGLRGNGDVAVDGFLPAGRTCYWGGWGGSVGIMDLDRRVTIGYVMNKMDQVGLGNARVIEYIKAVYKALGCAVETKL